MQIKCSECKYCYQDWEVDEETGEEFDYLYCEKTKEDLCHDTEKESCQYFKKYKSQKYVEKDTECDNCENAHFCSRLSVIAFDCTIMLDKHLHVYYDRTYCSKIDGTKWSEILRLRESGLKDSEIIEKIINEKLVEMIRHVKENGIELPEFIKEQCRKAGCEV